MPKKAKAKGGKKAKGKGKKKEKKDADPLVLLQKKYDALSGVVNTVKDEFEVEDQKEEEGGLSWQAQAIAQFKELQENVSTLEGLKGEQATEISELEETNADLKSQVESLIQKSREAESKMEQMQEGAGASLKEARKHEQNAMKQMANKLVTRGAITAIIYDTINLATVRGHCHEMVNDIEKNQEQDHSDDTEFDLAELKLDLHDKEALKFNTKKRILEIHGKLRDMLDRQCKHDEDDLEATVRHLQAKAFGNALRTVDDIMMQEGYGDMDDEKGKFSDPRDNEERLQQELHEVHEENERLQLKYKHLLDNEQIDSKDKERLLVEIETLREDLNYKDEEIRRLEFHNRQLEDEAQRQLHYAAEAKNRFNIQKFQMSDLLAKLDHERRRNETLVDDNRRLRMEIMDTMKKARTNAADAKKSKMHEQLTKDQNEHVSLLESELGVTKRALNETQRKNEDLFRKLSQLTGQHDEMSTELLAFREKMADREETIRQLRHGGSGGEASMYAAKTRDQLEDALSASQGRLKMLTNANNELEEQHRLLKNKVNNQRIIINRYEDADHPNESRKVVELRMACRQKTRIIGALEKQIKEAGEEPDYLPPREALAVDTGEKKRVTHYSSGMRRNELLLLG